MNYDPTNPNRFILSTGTSIYAHGGILGVAHGVVWEGGARRVDTHLTDAEKREVVEWVVTQWFRWGGQGPRLTNEDEVVIPKSTYEALLAEVVTARARGTA